MVYVKIVEHVTKQETFVAVGGDMKVADIHEAINLAKPDVGIFKLVCNGKPMDVWVPVSAFSLVSESKVDMVLLLGGGGKPKLVKQPRMSKEIRLLQFKSKIPAKVQAYRSKHNNKH